MKKVSTIIGLAVIVALSIGLAAAIGAATAKIRLPDRDIDLSCKTIEVGSRSYVLDGKASVVTTYASKTIKPGTIRLYSLQADKIVIEMTKDAKGNQTPAKATATGGVAITAKRAEIQPGSTAVTVQDIRATAREASLLEAQDVVVLTGSVVVKITEPGGAEPVATLDGDKLTLSLKDNKMRIESQSDKKAELTINPKEKEQSETSQK